MHNNKIVHFEIHAEEPERAAEFYRNAFGWTIEKWEGGGAPIEYWSVITGPKETKDQGVNGGLLKRPKSLAEEVCGSNAFVCTMLVEDYDATAAKILAAGGKEAMPKFALTGMAWQGYFIDTEGNTFGIHQPDTNAK